MNEEQMLFATEDQMALQETAVVEVQTEKYLIFVSDSLRYGLNAEQVKEIITNYSITYLPRVPHYIRGIVNLRGQIIPIIDIRSKMGKMECEATNSTCIIVLEVNSIQVGIYVDTVSLVADIDESKISPPSPHNKQELVSGMVSLGNEKTLFLMDCEKLIEN